MMKNITLPALALLALWLVAGCVPPRPPRPHRPRHGSIILPSLPQHGSAANAGFYSA
jgi:hypothetical protein